MNWIRLCSVLRPRQHSIGYMGDGFHRSKEPTNSIKVLKEQIVHRQIKHTISRHEHEQFLNGTSAQLVYTVPFMSVYVGKYMTEDKSKTDISTLQKLNKTQKKTNNTKQSKTTLAWFSDLLRHSARKQGGLIPQCSWAHVGRISVSQHDIQRDCKHVNHKAAGKGQTTARICGGVDWKRLEKDN